MISVEMLESRIIEFLKILFGSNDDSPDFKDIDVNADLISEVGFDSLEAFETVVALHNFLEVDMPEDIEIDSISSIHNIAEYLFNTYDQDTIKEFLNKDLSELAEMRKAEENVEI